MRGRLLSPLEVINSCSKHKLGADPFPHMHEILAQAENCLRHHATLSVSTWKGTIDRIEAELKQLRAIYDPIDVAPRIALVGDELYQAVRREVIERQSVSISHIQRKFLLGFSAAAALVDRLESDGVVSSGIEGPNARRVLVKQ